MSKANNEKQGLTKREFLKCGVLGVCGVMAQMSGVELLAKDSNKKNFTDINLSDGLWKWYKEAVSYIKTPRGLKCLLCPNFCIVKPGEQTVCRTRIHYKDKLYTIAYGNPCTVNIDPIEKKPLFHFFPESRAFSVAVAGCNLACLNCQNWTISQASAFDTKNYDLMPQQLIKKASESKCKSIAYTYSEPLAWYEYTFDSAKLAKAKGIKNVLVTCGYITEEPLRKLAKYIDAANVDLKGFSEELYMKLNGGTLEPILKTLQVLKEENVWLEITNLIVPSWTDDLGMIRDMCKWLYNNGMHESPLHFSRFQPLYKLKHLPATPVSVLEKARKIALDEGIKYVYIGNVPGHTAQNTYCPNCNKIILERRGYSILSNNIKNSQCNFCKEKISGVWN